MQSSNTSISPLRCLIVDDEPIAIKIIAANIEKLDFLVVEDTCSSAIEAAHVLKEKSIDLMFLDINMPDLSGLDFLESLDNAPMTIFTTAYSEYAIDAFRLQVVDYLLKPIGFQRFFQAAQRAKEIHQTQLMVKENKESFKTEMYIRQADSFHRIEWVDILYVEGMQNYLKLHFKDKTLIIHQTMTSIEGILPKDLFFRIHRSYLVNTSFIDKISGGEVYIYKDRLPIAKSRKEELLNSIVYTNLASK